MGTASNLASLASLILISSAEGKPVYSANLVFVAYAREFGTLDGQIMVFFVMTVAAAEVAVGLALIVTIFRSKASIDVDDVSILKG